MVYKNIIVEKNDRIATVVINRPQALNALNETTMLELESAMNELKHADTWVIIITGAGEKAFIAGADIAAMSQMDTKQAKAFSKLGQRITNLIENHPRPVIAAINGYALGGGCEIALACDIRIASDNAKIGQPEINLGVICGWGATQRLPKIIGRSKAKEIIFTGDIIDANSAEKIGLVNRVVPSCELLPKAKELAKTLAKKPAIALALTKKAINKSNEVSLKQGLEFEAECFSQCFTTEDQKEGMDAFLNKRKPIFKGS